MNNFTQAEVEAALAVKKQVLETDESEIKAIYMAGEICMWHELSHLRHKESIAEMLSKIEGGEHKYSTDPTFRVSIDCLSRGDNPAIIISQICDALVKANDKILELARLDLTCDVPRGKGNNRCHKCHGTGFDGLEAIKECESCQGFGYVLSTGLGQLPKSGKTYNKNNVKILRG